jgi:hypothetical protein
MAEGMGIVSAEDIAEGIGSSRSPSLSALAQFSIETPTLNRARIPAVAI